MLRLNDPFPYSLDPESLCSWSREGGDPGGDRQEGVELTEVEHQLRSKGAPTLVLAHLEVLETGNIIFNSTVTQATSRTIWNQLSIPGYKPVISYLGRIVPGCVGGEIVISDVVFLRDQPPRYQIKGSGNVRGSHSHLQVQIS